MSEGSDDNTVQPADSDRVAQLWRRLKDHRIAQWTVGYVAVAYAIQHGVVLTTESLDWPHPVERATMVALALGLPLAIVFAWYHGHSANRRVTGPELTIISLLLVGISFLFFVFVQPKESAANALTPPAIHGVSLAVLPFVNLSGDASQEFFSDGMTEEITAALAKVPELRVVGRTSAFQFKGENKDLRAIGQALAATHLIEGSVRKDGNQVRITAQLVKAADGTHVWTESYDRELKGVFAVQEEIAQAIAASLQVPLGLKQGEKLVPSRTNNETAYEAYLRAKGLVRLRSTNGFTQLTQAAKLLEQVVADEPDYAPAWALLSLDYILTPGFDSEFMSDEKERMRLLASTLIPKADMAARRAIELNPKSSDAYVAYASVEAGRGHLAKADELFRRALELDPGNADGLHIYSGILADAGYIKEAVPLREALQALEPLVPVFQINQSRVLFASGNNDAALAALRLPNVANQYAIAYAAQGRYAEAADTLLRGPNIFLPDRVEAAAKLLREAPRPASSPQNLPRLGFLEFAYVHVGASSRVLDIYDDMLETGWHHPTLTIMLWAPSYASVRRTDRFKTFVRKAGYVDYWKARGWPDLCHPVGADDFVCN